MGEADGYTNCDGLRTHAITVCGQPLCFAIRVIGHYVLLEG